MKYTSTVSNDELWRSLCDNVVRLCALASNREKLSDQHLHRMIRSLESPVDSTISRIVLDAVQRAEKRCPFSSGLTLRTLAAYIENTSKQNKCDRLLHVKNILASTSEQLEIVLSESRIPTKQEFNFIVNKYVHDKTVRDLAGEIIDLGGLDGKFTIEVGKNGVTSPVVESTLGYNFSCTSALQIDLWSKSDVRIVIIDGTIEFVHEIHHLLEKMGSLPIVIIARMFSDEVLHTFKVNNARGTLCILPIAIPIEIEQMNALKDIAVTCCSHVVTSVMGETISAIKFDDISIVDSVSYRAGLLTIANNKSVASVEAHRCFLLEARDRGNPEIARLYEMRIKSMSPNHTLIKLPSSYDALAVSSFSQDLGSCLQLVRAIHEMGVHVHNNEFDFSLRDIIAQRIASMQLSVLASFEMMLLQEEIK